MGHNWSAAEGGKILRECACSVTPEKRFSTPLGDDFVDLWATHGDQSILVEVETSPRHALDNLRKGRFVPCNAYVILCTTQQCREGVRRLLRRMDDRPSMDIRLATLATLATEVARIFRRRIGRGKRENEPENRG